MKKERNPTLCPECTRTGKCRFGEQAFRTADLAAGRIPSLNAIEPTTAVGMIDELRYQAVEGRNCPRADRINPAIKGLETPTRKPMKEG